MCSDAETEATTDVDPTAPFSIISQQESRDSLITHSHTIVTAAICRGKTHKCALYGECLHDKENSKEGEESLYAMVLMSQRSMI